MSVVDCIVSTRTLSVVGCREYGFLVGCRVYGGLVLCLS